MFAGPSSKKQRTKKATTAAAAAGVAKAVRPRKAAVAKAPARKKAADPYELEDDASDDSDEDAPRCVFCVCVWGGGARPPGEGNNGAGRRGCRNCQELT